MRGRMGRLSARAVVAAEWVAMNDWQSWRVPAPWETKVESLGSEARQQMLDRKIDQASDGLDELADQVAAERDRVSVLEELLDRRRELLWEVERLHLRARQAEVNLRRAERSLAREKAREVETDLQGDRARRGRMVKLQVDPSAWQVFAIDAKRRHRWLGWELGQLVVAEVALIEVSDAIGLPSARRRRAPGEGEPQPVQRSLRAFVDEEVWPLFAAVVAQCPLTLGRYLGALVEARAHDLGWRAS